MVEPFILQTKSIGYTTEKWRTYQEEEEIAPQRLERYAPVLLIREPQ